MALTKITNSLVAINAIQGTLIADNAVTAVHIVNNAITATQLADNAVTATKIQNGIIATDHLAADLITAAKIADDAISEEHLDVTVISSLSAVTANSSDYIMIGDASDSNNLKKVLVSDLQQTDEEIADIVGAMVSSNTESGITVAYQDGDNTLDFTVGTLNQNTTGTAATVTTAAQPNITSTGTLTSFRSTGIDDNADALAMTITSDENLYIGQTASSGVRGSDNRVQISGTGLDTSSLIIHRYAANAYGPGLGFAKSRHGTIGSHTIVQDDDILGFLSFYGSDGDDFVSHAAEISCQVDGTPGSNDTPGRLTFSTTADGAASATERMRIDASGRVGIGQTDMNTYEGHLYTKASVTNLRHIIHNTSGSGIRWELNSASSGSFYIGNPSLNALTITSAGASTFGGDVAVPNLSVADDIGHTGDANTYMSWNADNLTFYNGGVNSLFMDSGQVVVNEAGGDVNFRVESTGNDHMLFVDGGNNRVGIGTGGPDHPLVVSHSGNACLQLYSSDNTTAMVMLGCAQDNNAAGIGYNRSVGRLWMTAGGGSENSATSAFVLTGTGSVGIGTNNPDTKRLMVTSAADDFTAHFINSHGSTPKGVQIEYTGSSPNSNSAYWFLYCEDTTEAKAKLRSNGYFYLAGTAYGSDRELKENIVDTPDSLTKLKQIRVRDFNLKGQSEKHTGVIAQEIETLFPDLLGEEVISKEDAEVEKKIKTVEYNGLIGILVKSVQELTAKVEALEG